MMPTKLAMAEVFDVLLETGINISPLPVWLDEWVNPETCSMQQERHCWLQKRPFFLTDETINQLTKPPKDAGQVSGCPSPSPAGRGELRASLPRRSR